MAPGEQPEVACRIGLGQLRDQDRGLLRRSGSQKPGKSRSRCSPVAPDRAARRSRAASKMGGGATCPPRLRRECPLGPLIVAATDARGGALSIEYTSDPNRVTRVANVHDSDLPIRSGSPQCVCFSGDGCYVISFASTRPVRSCRFPTLGEGANRVRGRRRQPHCRKGYRRWRRNRLARCCM